MLYAHVTGETIEQVGALPRLWFDGTRWWDFRDDAHDPTEFGWLPVTVEPRPDDTDTTTWERTEPTLIAGLPVIGWTERDKTAEELQAEADAAAAQARYETHEGILDATAALMEDAHEDGAAWVQPLGAHDAVPFGRTVTHDGKEWRSKHHANVWPPSSSSPWWEEVIDGEPEPQPWALDTYYTPPTKVTFDGQTYECTFEHLSQVGWEPNNPTMHSVWRLA